MIGGFEGFEINYLHPGFRDSALSCRFRVWNLRGLVAWKASISKVPAIGDNVRSLKDDIASNLGGYRNER